MNSRASGTNEPSDETFDFTFAHSETMGAFLPFYPDTESCYADYAERVSRNFSAPRPTCECCSSSDRVSLHLAKWEVQYQNRQSNRQNLLGLVFLLVGHIYLHRASIHFTTDHAFCSKCRLRFSSKRLVTVPLSFVVTLLSYFPVVVTVLGIFYLILGVAGDEKPGFVAWSVVSVAAVLIPVLFWLRCKADRIAVPSILRPIAKHPVIFRGLSKIVARGDQSER